MTTLITAFAIFAGAAVHTAALPLAPARQPSSEAAWDRLAESLPPAAWALQDPADSLWRVARQHLDRGDNAAAASAYRRIRTESSFANSAYRAHAFYWEAFARHRMGSVGELRTARNVLDNLLRSHPNFENIAEARRLQARIDGDLAARGDVQSATRATAAATAAAQAAPRPPNPAAPPTNRPPRPPAAPRASSSAQCPDSDLRAAAVESLISMPPEHALPILEQIMARKDECNAKLRETAVFMIAQKRVDRAEDILLDAARTDPNAGVRQQAVFWLSQVNSERAVAAIEEILRTSTDAKMVEHAVFALSQHGDARATRLLRDIAGRQNVSHEARKHAIFWLGQRADAETRAFLRGLYPNAPDNAAREAIIFAVSQRSDPSSVNWLLDIAMNEREGAEARKQALFWAGREGNLPLDRLTRLYATMPNREMKEQVIFALSQRREAEALDQMISIARTEQDRQLRQTLLFWIGRSNDPKAARFLAEIIGS